MREKAEACLCQIRKGMVVAMNLLHCQKLLLKTGMPMEDNGKQALDFTCEKTGLHFRLDPTENPARSDQAGNLCLLCAKNCPIMKT